MILVDQLKDSVTDFWRRHVDVTRPEIDFVNNLCEIQDLLNNNSWTECNCGTDEQIILKKSQQQIPENVP